MLSSKIYLLVPSFNKYNILNAKFLLIFLGLYRQPRRREEKPRTTMKGMRKLNG
jgi:hypothetical protein